MSSPGLWPGDIVTDPDGRRHEVVARGIRDGERYVMLVSRDRHRSVTLMPMSAADDCGPYTVVGRCET